MTDKISDTADTPRPAPVASKAAEVDLRGTTLGRYLLLRKLGKGGMGVVYEAEDSLLNRRVAVKLLPDTLKRAPRLLERFFVEAQVAARLNHPNIIAIYDIGEGGGTFFIGLCLSSGNRL